MPRGFSTGLKSHDGLDFDCVICTEFHTVDQGLSSYRGKDADRRRCHSEQRAESFLIRLERNSKQGGTVRTLVQQIFEAHREKECAGSFARDAFGIGGVADGEINMAYQRETQSAADSVPRAQFRTGRARVRDVEH